MSAAARFLLRGLDLGIRGSPFSLRSEYSGLSYRAPETAKVFDFGSYQDFLGTVRLMPDQEVIVRLHGLYDNSRREELAMAMIPILSGLSTKIDFEDVEHIDVEALASLLPSLQSRSDDGKPFINAMGMNEDVRASLRRAGLGTYFVNV